MRGLSASAAILLALTSYSLVLADEPKPLVVCSTTQVADFARQVVGDRMEVRSILAAGQDPHVYEIKPNDAALVSRALLCFDNGWHLEGADWMRKLAENAKKPITSCVTGATPLEIPGGAAHDPHAWFSPANAAVYVRNIRDAVSEQDPKHRDEYHARAQLYLDQLRTLDGWIRRQLNVIPVEKRILVTSHDAFNYFCRDYQFKAATPVGWSTGSEVGGGVTPERRSETVNSIRQFGVRSIFVETSVSPQLIRQIADEAGVSIGGELYSDSMGPAGSAGETYFGMMRENVLTIASGLR
ncbi:metal ABC transporter solute-binding protein, Zn/Mn family [Blastopirellula retiformator]|uniref:Manganese ABC transporter substrate-binding lipoprotein n=1 Tax=Blastopirellula retiformator TaxID=2527970 RepID=A0A5C5USF2_9BACT|nr:zinc ABC transporter substrate-binding protein [Blastopirellula retiformator]TWT29304.1 Manganese ABC transporter substrate-binding lipoprotein precursor [Blastopirellula retiformator]